MTLFTWIFASGLLMSAIAFVGGFAFLLNDSLLKKVLLPLVAFSAGSLIGGALFHMLPESIEHMGNGTAPYAWLAFGFLSFFALEQFLHWHHCHHSPSHYKHPVTHLLLIADGVHNLIGGLAVGASFLIDIRLGIATWIAAAAHEVPQELGDFAVLVHGGWKKGKALFANFISALPFLLGGLIVYFVSTEMDVAFLVPFAAGNFLYIAAADLIPEVKHSSKLSENIIHLIAFIAGLVLLFVMRGLLNH